MKIKLPVVWEMCGMVEIEADSIEKAIVDFDPDQHTLPDGDYVDGSFGLATDNANIIKLYNKSYVHS